MKKTVSIVLVFALLFSFCFAAEAETNTVVQMTCIVKMPDVIREGKYTGEVQEGVPHGYGIFEATNSEGVNWHYIGQWVNGSMTGKGGQYWDDGRSTVGTYENGSMISGYIYTSSSEFGWVDYKSNTHGCIDIKEFRGDGSLMFDGCMSLENATYHKGTIYTKSGEVFFSGEIGEGFNWNLLYIE